LRGDERPHVLIAALSGRALAAAARRSGWVPLVADRFGDEDTRALAGDLRVVADDGDAAWLAALDSLALASGVGGRALKLACGGGFEHRPDLLRAAGARWTLLGNDADTVAAVGDPWRFAAACAACGVAHPEVARASVGPGWLEKQAGGAGGWHVRVPPDGVAPLGHYRQRVVPGQPVSALFLAAGGRACLLGWSSQWADPAPGAPWRYGGGVRPAPAVQGVAALLSALAARFGLAGLNSADFLVRGDQAVLLEINPRPGASLDLFGHEALFAMHAQACAGVLPEAIPSWHGARAACVVYARQRLTVPPDFRWPDWTADRQMRGSAVAAEDPLCTVLAEADTPADAQALLVRRARDLMLEMECPSIA
jgi:predicted ATP-grasp superfamily ATP-dependent carboligase